LGDFETMLRKKGGILTSEIGKIILAALFLAIVFMFAFPKMGISKTLVFETLRIGEGECPKTGTNYGEQVEDLKNGILDGEPSSTKATYEMLETCFPERNEETKDEIINSFNSYIENEKIYDGEKFVELYDFVKTKLRDDMGEIDEEKLKRRLEEGYLKLIQTKYDEVQEYVDKALNPQMTKFQWINDNKKYVKREFESFKEVCKQKVEYSEVQQKITRDCNRKIEEIENSLIAIECLYWKELGAFEQYLAYSQCDDQPVITRAVIDTCAIRLGGAYIHYLFLIGKNEDQPQCGSIIEDAKNKQNEIVQKIDYINEKYPHKDKNDNYELNSAICDNVGNMPRRDRQDEATKSEVSKVTCDYLKEKGEVCSKCA